VSPRATDVNGLWHLLARRPWTTLAIVCPEESPKVAQLAKELVDAAAHGHPRLVEAADVGELHLKRAAAQGRASSPSPAEAEQPRFILSVDKALKNAGAAELLAECDAVLLLVMRGQSRLPDTARTVKLVGRERLLGAVLGS
jgi:hypothetical protein